MRHPSLLRRLGFIVVVSILAASAGPLAATAAGASPIDDKKAEAARLTDAINANGDKISALDEEMNGAQLKLQDAQAQFSTAKQAITVAKQQSDGLKATLGQQSTSIYTDAVSPGVDLSGSGLSDSISAAARSTYAAAAAKKTDGTISQLTVVNEQLAQKETTYEAANFRVALSVAVPASLVVCRRNTNRGVCCFEASA